MNICIVTLAQTYEGAGKLYNTQDLGLGKAFAELGHNVSVLRFEKRSTPQMVEYVNKQLVIYHYRVRSIGGNSLCVSRFLPKDVSAFVCFSDNQLSFWEVYHHCRRYKIKLVPYIGVIESHSDNWVIKAVMNKMACFNIRLYKNMQICAKTVDVKNELSKRGVNTVTIAPVCLDKDSLINCVTNEQRLCVRKSLLPDDNKNIRIILFVGRLSDEKRPLEALEIFHCLFKENNNYRFLIVGKGKLEQKVKEYIAQNNLDGVVSLYKDIPNNEMWKYFVAADCSLNLNRVEIFGMSILEAMYYECPVVAYAAPGPQMIITNKRNGYLCDNISEIVGIVRTAIANGRLVAARRTIEREFLWNKTAKIILNLCQ